MENSGIFMGKISQLWKFALQWSIFHKCGKDYHNYGHRDGCGFVISGISNRFQSYGNLSQYTIIMDNNNQNCGKAFHNYERWTTGINMEN